MNKKRETFLSPHLKEVDKTYCKALVPKSPIPKTQIKGTAGDTIIQWATTHMGMGYEPFPNMYA